MKSIARLAVVTVLAATPVLGAAPSAHACFDLEGRCLVNCVEDLIEKGTCRL